MFRSARRDIVFPQLEHARLAAAIAVVWGNETFAPPPVERQTFVTGVALHDRGYAPFDHDGIGEVAPERWLEIQRESFRPRGQEPLVDLIVAMHIHRLVLGSRSADAAAEFAARLPALRDAAGLSEAEAAATDRLTNVCDRIAFDFCFEERTEGGLQMPTRSGNETICVRYRVDGDGTVTIEPWPLDVPRLDGVLVAYRALGYPTVLEPEIVPYVVRPDAGDG
jgi:hypothetical protein